MKRHPLKWFCFLPVLTMGISACHQCHECHYDYNSGEVELGEFCDDDLEEIEANGYSDTSGTYEVHCHEH